MNTTQYILEKYGKTDYQGEMPIQLDILRDDLAGLFNELNLNVGVEIGVAGGRFSQILLEGHPNMQLTGVDPYLSYDEYFDFKTQEIISGFIPSMKKRIDKHKDRFKLIQKTSLEAVKDFKDNSLDFVYIDGNHLFQYVVNDLAEWGKKIKSGGIISGHDFEVRRKPDCIHAEEVVRGWTAAYDIKPWFITKRARRYNQDGNVHRSFFWEKI